MVGKHFTRDEIEELRKSLATSSMKDSDLDDARKLLLTDYVAVVQDGKNRKVSVEDLGDFLTERRHIIYKESDSHRELPNFSCDVLIINTGTDNSIFYVNLPIVSEQINFVVRVASSSECKFLFKGGNIFDTRKSEKVSNFSLTPADASIVWLDFVSSDNLWYATY